MMSWLTNKLLMALMNDKDQEVRLKATTSLKFLEIQPPGSADDRSLDGKIQKPEVLKKKKPCLNSSAGLKARKLLIS
jgi:hypothetical protein